MESLTACIVEENIEQAAFNTVYGKYLWHRGFTSPIGAIKKECRQKLKKAQQRGFSSIFDRWQRDPKLRASWLAMTPPMTMNAFFARTIWLPFQLSKRT